MIEDWRGVCCCAGSVLMYLLRKAALMDAESLRKITRIDRLADLSLLLDTASIVLPLIVGISGKVGSDKPVKCKSTGLQCVTVMETIEKRILKRETKTIVDSNGDSKDVKFWKEELCSTHSVEKEVPWYLNDGTGKVFVVEGRPSYKKSTCGNDRVYRAESLPISGTLDNSQGAMDLVVTTTRPVLLTGTPLTVIGQAVKDDTGKIRIQRPKKGRFQVSKKNIDELIDECEVSAWIFTGVSLVLAVSGIYLIGKQTFQYIMGRNCNQKPHRVLDAATETPGSDDKESKPEAGDGLGVTELIPDLDLCVICLEQEYNSVLVPCGHMCCCVDCSSNLTECPLCRQRINQAVKVFRG